MRSFLLIGLVALTTTVYARERRADNKFRKFSPFLVNKRGTDYVPGHSSSGGPPSGFFQPISGPIGHSLPRSIANYGQHQGFEQPTLSHNSPLSLLASSSFGAGNGLGSLGMSLAGPNGHIYALPMSSIQVATGKAPISFGFHNGLSGYSGSAYMKPIYPTGMQQSLASYVSGSHGSSLLPVEAAPYGQSSYSSPTADFSTAGLQSIQPQSNAISGGHGYNLPEMSQGLSGGLVFLDNSHGSLSYSNPSKPQSNSPSPNYHTGLSSGSSDSSSYNLPVSSHSYPAESGQSHSRYRPAPVSSAGSSYSGSSGSPYSFPKTNYGTPSNYIQPAPQSQLHTATPTNPSYNPTVHYSPPSSYTSSQSSYNTLDSHDSSSSVNYASPSGSYSLSDYPNQSYGYSTEQASSNINPIHSNQASLKTYNEEVPKYDTISYSMPSEKY